MTKILQINSIEKYYGTKGIITKALDNITLEVNKGEFVGIMGASGSGKTTLLNCISTIDKVSAGNIIIDDKDINQINDKDIAKFRWENLGFIFQDFNLLDTLTIEENIALALTINRTTVYEINDKVKKISEELGIFEVLNKFPYEISGGQKQRCACARALSKEFGTYLILGMETKDVSKLFLWENTFMGAISFIFGTVGGVFLFQLLTYIVIGFFGQDYQLVIGFSFKALFLTLFYYGAIMIAVVRTIYW